MSRWMWQLLGCLGVVTAASGWGFSAQAQSLVLASTTSTEQSGLLSYLLPEFKKRTGIEVKVVAVGTGQALDMARRGDADVLLVHDQAAEERLVVEGHVLKRYDMMYNDFVLVGPKSDPAQAQGRDIAEAFKKVALTQLGFVSRGDKSGTHAAEWRYWRWAGVDPVKSAGYKECGCGMGPALNMAAALGAYVLTDRGTWLSFKNKADLTVLVEGDKRMFNPYGVMQVNPLKHPHVKAAEGKRLVEWLLSPAGQGVVASYKVGGAPLFFPNAGP